MRSQRLFVCGALAVSCALVAQAARAASITFTATSGSNLSAKATFAVDTSTTGGPFLKVTLSNTAGVGASDPTQLLTVLDFQSNTVLSLANGDGSAGHPKSYAVASGIDGTPVLFSGGPFNSQLDAGYQWGLQNVSGGKSWAVGSTGIGGMGLGTADLFENGQSMSGLGSPTGGILPPLGVGSGGGSSLTHTPYFVDTITFYIYGINSNFDPSTSISNVRFLYGTANNDANLPGLTPPVPLPAAAWSGMAMLAGLGILRRLTRRTV